MKSRPTSSMRCVLISALVALGSSTSLAHVSGQSPEGGQPRGWGIFNPRGPSDGDDATAQASASVDRKAVIAALPLDRLTPEARRRLLDVVEKPTMFRRLPTETIRCDRDMFLFLARHPDVLVGLWDLMGITKVQSRRVGPYQIEASDGMGTLCQVDLIYGDGNTHIFQVDGTYEGKLTPGAIRGKGVFVLHSAYGMAADGETTISGTLDCFVQLDSLGVDLIVRTLSPIIGRSADGNFAQTAQFIAQINEASIRNPPAMLDVAQRLPQVTPPIRQTFGETIVTVARRSQTLAVNRRGDVR